MKTVSRLYKDSMNRQLREKSHCVVVFGNTNINAISDGKWEGTSATIGGKNITNFGTLEYSTVYGNRVFLLDMNRCILDGKTSVKDTFDGEGAILEPLSDNHGVTDSAFRKRFTHHQTLSGITIGFNSRNGTHPYKVTARYYKDGEVIASGTVYPTDTECTVEIRAVEVDEMEIEATADLPYWHFSVEEIKWGIAKVYTDSQLISVAQHHDVDPLSRRLPDETLRFTIADYNHEYDPDNPQGAYSYITKGAPISVHFGYEADGINTEWIKADTYSLESQPEFADSKVTFKGSGLTGILTSNYHKGVYENISLYDLAEDVLHDAESALNASGSFHWEIDQSLRNIYTNGAALPVDTHAKCLQLIAHAGRCRLFTDDDNVIHLKAFGITPVGIFNGVYSDNGHMPYSEWASADYGNSTAQTYATLELNRFVLDGSNKTYPAENQDRTGYTALALSDQYGTTNSSWSKEFDVSHDLPLIRLTFDEVMGQHPYKLGIEYFTALGNVFHTATVYPDSTSAIIDTEGVTDCTKIRVTAYSVLPYSRSRLTKVAFRETDFALTLDSIKEKSLETTKLEQARNISVKFRTPKVNANVTTLFDDDVVLDDSELVHIDYQTATDIEILDNEEPYTCEVPLITSSYPEESLVTDENETIIVSESEDFGIYANAADLPMATGTHHVVITGKTIGWSEQTYILKVNPNGEDDTIDNPLILTASEAGALAQHDATYLGLRTTYDATYRGNPELEVGDIIEIETTFSDVVYGLMLTDDISYNGSLSGKVKVKGLQ